MNMAAALILLAVSLFPIGAVNSAQPPPLRLSHSQAIVIVKASRLGGLVFAAIILQESSACTLLHSAYDPHAFGCGQLHSDTADGIYGTHIPERVLLSEQNLNLEIAYRHLRNCVAEFGWQGGITCYQAGSSATAAMTKYQREHSDYQATIMKRMRELESLPWSTE